MNEQWRQQLREKMADYQRPAPDISWDKIDQALASRKSRLSWLRRMAAIALLLLIAGACYWTLRLSETTEEYTNPTAVVSNLRQPKNAPETMEPTIPTKPLSDKKPTAPVSLVNPQKDTSADTLIPSDTVAATPQNEVEPVPAVERKSVPDKHRPQVVYPADFQRKSHSSRHLTAKVFFSNTMASSSTVTSSSQMLMERTIHRNTYEVPVNSYSGDLTRIVSKDELYIGTTKYLVAVYDTVDTWRTQQTEEHVQHHQPVRFGLSLRYQLSNRWSVESGLSYTRLSSDITTTVDGVATTDEQRLNYLGIPLNIGYQLWTSRHLSFYVMAGGMVEKMLNDNPWQFSLNGASGAEYRLMDHISLYAEPGVGYYFSDGSSITNIYKDHPLNFNLSFGLRINLNTGERP